MPSWTPEQHSAIYAGGGSLLVSAAAGSGKTAVLVRRVIEKLTDKNKPCSADRLLVVTFTKAAAAEMKARISLALSELISKDPANNALRRQKLLLEHAKISTIHSFCADLVRENFNTLNIPSDFQIADEAELKVMEDDAVNEILEEQYAEASRKSFLKLVEQVSNERSDKELAEKIKELYKFISSAPFPQQWMEEVLAFHSPEMPIEHSIWGRIIIRHIKRCVQHCLNVNLTLQSEAMDDALLNEKFGADFALYTSLHNRILSSNDFAEIGRLLKAFTWSAWRWPKNEDKRETQKQKRDLQKTIVNKLIGDYFGDIFENYAEDEEAQRELIGVMFGLIRLFEARFKEKKRQRKCLDFSDLEHLALNLLVRQEGGTQVRTELARELSLCFDEVMVDEYQDTNHTQEAIFKAVSQDEGNLFMVGDIKQSIYGFRQAKPGIFLEKYNRYASYASENPSFPAKIILGRNFRSRESVTDFVNFFFEQAMSKESGGLAYDENQALIHGANMPPLLNTEAELCLISAGEKEESKRTEAAYIAKRINTMLAERYMVFDKELKLLRPAEYRDFRIILRAAKGEAGKLLAEELEAAGIPVYIPKEGGFFASREVLWLISLLRVIDNPLQDIPLLASLLSPFFGFTPDETARIRILSPQKPLYLALGERAREGDAKCAGFLKFTEELRRAAVTLTSEQLISRIYERTGYTSIVQAMENGQNRLANLLLMLEYAARFEASGYRGISGFIRFIDRLAEQRAELNRASTASENANVVRIMSIHKSKGLEFPVCIIADTGKQFNRMDQYKNLLIHSDYGMGMRIFNQSTRERKYTLAQKAIRIELENEMIAEELRILYVAMTRAREKLIITGFDKKLEENITTAAQKLDGGEISAYDIQSAKGYLEWLILCALRHPYAAKLRELCPDVHISPLREAQELKIDIVTQVLVKEQKIQQEQPEESEEAELSAELADALDYIYPHSNLQGVPVKITASNLAKKEEGRLYAAVQRPSFMRETALTPTEKGTALHKYMQFANYAAAAASSTAELKRLIEQGYLTAAEGASIKTEQVDSFFNSPLARDMQSAEAIFREIRFTSELPVSTVLPEVQTDEKLILQGVADCVYKKDGKLYIVDYKTNRVKDGQELLAHYGKQLSLYKAAIEERFGLPVAGCFIYSFYLGAAVANFTNLQ
ncbi:MAG: helicase-exonuclease AddAB subunit AddA [Oscillospiraceae bacterium]|jgi:ATP-dependent helicase/nuclease subunit A|nr:helicase-exonuclease AddAB subunit AddA [Oscillospiraceae bacterium]